MDMIDSLDQPVITAIQYFTNCMNYFMSIATRSGLFFGIIGLAWTGFKIANSRMQLREAWWDTIYKWIAYILLLSCWLPLTNGISKLANNIGTTAGNKSSSIESQLKEFRGRIGEFAFTQTKEGAEKMKSIALQFSTDVDEYSGSNLDSYAVELITLINNSKASEKKKRENIKKIQEKRNEIENLGSMVTLKSINQIIGDKEGVSNYVASSLVMKGDPRGFLSGASVFRFSLLICQILWTNNELDYTKKLNAIDDDDDLNGIQKAVSKAGASITQLGEVLMCMVLCFGILLSSIFSIIQYMMTCIEFVIISAVGVFFIPMVLFDVTKELPKKFIPVFMSLFTKLLIITLCMYYVMWSYLNIANAIFGSPTGLNWFNIGCILLQVILGFVLTSNAPKIATTITTGQAQLSMGEFVAGAMVGVGAGKAIKKVNEERHKSAEIIDRPRKAHQARNEAKQTATANGATKKEAKKAGSTAAHAVYRPNGYHASSYQAQNNARNISNFYTASNKPAAQQAKYNEPAAKTENIKNVNIVQETADNALKNYDSTKSPDA